ncbi:MAG: hypothetical protein K6D96_01675 [Acetatifactor sp.]|nr:hypothetical protein [Acetatifactor sp.]
MSEIKEKVEAELKTVKALCETIENAIKNQVDRGLDKVDTHELYEAVDIYKDLSEVKKNVIESCYKMQVMEAMENYGEEEDEEERRYYNRNRYSNGRFAPKGRGTRRGYHMTPEIYRSYPDDWERDMDLFDGRMYYSEGGSQGGNQGGSQDGSSRGYSEGYSEGNRDGYTRGYSEGQRSGRGGNQRDYREGRSGQSRRSYMESKEMGKEKSEKMKELEKYTSELTEDVTEMLKDASAEEKALLRNKMQVLMQKV